MAYVPMNRTRALIICTRAQDYALARLREAARYLLDRRDATEAIEAVLTSAIGLEQCCDASRRAVHGMGCAV